MGEAWRGYAASLYFEDRCYTALKKEMMKYFGVKLPSLKAMGFCSSSRRRQVYIMTLPEMQEGGCI